MCLALHTLLHAKVYQFVFRRRNEEILRVRLEQKYCYQGQKYNRVLVPILQPQLSHFSYIVYNPPRK